jgi:hypothetical protein
VLAGIPKIVSKQERMLHRWRVTGLAAGTAAVAVVLGAFLSRFFINY